MATIAEACKAIYPRAADGHSKAARVQHNVLEAIAISQRAGKSDVRKPVLNKARGLLDHKDRGQVLEDDPDPSANQSTSGTA